MLYTGICGEETQMNCFSHCFSALCIIIPLNGKLSRFLNSVAFGDCSSVRGENELQNFVPHMSFTTVLGWLDGVVSVSLWDVSSRAVELDFLPSFGWWSISSGSSQTNTDPGLDLEPPRSVMSIDVCQVAMEFLLFVERGKFYVSEPIWDYDSGEEVSCSTAW